MVKPPLDCPACGSNAINKTGTTQQGNQNCKGRDCGRQFVENPKWKRIGGDTTSLIDQKTLSFSKKLENHLQAIWNFIHPYTEQRQ